MNEQINEFNFPCPECGGELKATERPRVGQCQKCYNEWHRKPSKQEYAGFVGALKSLAKNLTIEIDQDKADLRVLERRMKANLKLRNALVRENPEPDGEADKPEVK